MHNTDSDTFLFFVWEVDRKKCKVLSWIPHTCGVTYILWRKSIQGQVDDGLDQFECKRNFASNKMPSGLQSEYKDALLVLGFHYKDKTWLSQYEDVLLVMGFSL